MEGTDEDALHAITVAVANSVVVATATAGFRAGWIGIFEPQLRSQNLLSTLLPVPQCVTCLSEAVIYSPEWVCRGTHGQSDLASLRIANLITPNSWVGCVSAV